MNEAHKLIEEYQSTRKQTEALCRSLLIEEYVIQGMEDVSPPKWHLAHTTWFFDTFVLNQYTPYNNAHRMYEYIFNSYYQGIGKPYPRKQRGLLARPSVQEIYEYRKEVDERILDLMNSDLCELTELQALIVLGIHHEQQHQELMLMDIKYNFFLDPTFPPYQVSFEESLPKPFLKKEFIPIKGGLNHIGYDGEGFCFDNERPLHPTFIEDFSISNSLVSNQDYLEFIEDRAYSTPSLWLSDAWDWVQMNQIKAPLYWKSEDKQWQYFTLSGLKPLESSDFVSHISFYEADAFAKWKGCRLATEEEWEFAAKTLKENNKDTFFWGALWEWTSTAYLPYPGYKPLPGIVGEYNAKFMNNQRVLRGASFATPSAHRRLTYRNFYGPDKRWPFCGIRLASEERQ